MSTKLYPPTIEGALPAFYLNYDASSKVLKPSTLTVPFTMNNGVSANQVHGFSLRLRTVASGKYIFEPIYSNTYSLANGEVTFSFDVAQCKKLTEGQYYKVQIAYCGSQVKNAAGVVSGTDIGYYSTVGVIKCTSKPKVSIRGLAEDTLNFFTNDFFGLYDVSDCNDQTEKVYSYEFTVYDEDDNIYWTSGEQLHRTYQDTEYTSSIDRISLNDFAGTSSLYSIQYKVTTLNNLIVTTPKYKITSEYLVSPNQTIEILPESNEEEGYIDVKFKGVPNKDFSYYYVLNTSAFDAVETDENNQVLTDGGLFPLIEYVKSILAHERDKLGYIDNHSLYRILRNNGHNIDSYFYYTFKLNRPPKLTEYNGFYYPQDQYENLEAEYKAGVLTKEEFERQLSLCTEIYVKILNGNRTIKRFSLNDIAKNFIDLDNYYILGYTEKEESYYGSYLLSRASEEDNYSVWYNLTRFRWDDEYPSKSSFRDYTAEHGRRYKYALQQYNIWGLYSARIESDIYMATFEDAYLYDGEKTLRIRYNPEVSSFKTTILEQKTDTLGGRFPYITRNGQTYYKEFPIGGLLAAELDKHCMFIDPEYGEGHRHATKELASDVKNMYRDYHLFSNENIGLEKDFKIRVLEWLNDGRPKLFKSPYEGNYIVRLLNNSLTPVNELGRLLHSFSSTAYEIAEYIYDNLVAFGFLKTNYPSDLLGLWKSYNLADETTDGDIIIELDSGIQSFTVQDMMPGDMIYITIIGEDSELPIMIGITGSYTFKNITGKVTKIRIPQRTDPFDKTKPGSKLTGIISCFYEGMRITAFDAIISMQLKTLLSQQYIGVNPRALQLKTNEAWGVKNNLGLYSFGLNDWQIKVLQNYNIRDDLDDTLKITRTSSGKTTQLSYAMNDDGLRLIRSFDPNDILQQVNLTLNRGEVYKTKLVNIEMLRFYLRPCIPVYIHTNRDEDEYKINGKYTQDGMTEDKSTKPKTLWVSTSPYGYPHPIEEIAKIEMLDPFCVFQVLRLNRMERKDENWSYSTNDSVPDGSYYDPYYREWLPEAYDPTVKMNYTWKQVVCLGRKNDNESYSAKAIELIEKNEINQELKRKKEQGLYQEAEINEKEMFDYELFYDNKNADHFRYYYYKNGHPIEIKNQHYDLYEKINSQYVLGKQKTDNVEEEIKNQIEDYRVYWVKEYETNFNLLTEKSIELRNLKDVNCIHIGNGVVAEMNFQLRIIDYYTEINDPDVAAAKEKYLNAKNFYTTIFDTYNSILAADLDCRRYTGLKNLYEKLLFGKELNKNLSIEDINAIEALRSNDLEKEKLKLMTLYQITKINTGLSQSLINDLLTIKNSEIHNEDDKFGMDYIHFYDLTDTDGSITTIALDTSDDHFIIFDAVKQNNKIKLTIRNNQIFNKEQD